MNKVKFQFDNELLNGKDEIGEICRTIKKMREELIRIVSFIKEVSDLLLDQAKTLSEKTIRLLHDKEPCLSPTAWFFIVLYSAVVTLRIFFIIF